MRYKQIISGIIATIMLCTMISVTNVSAAEISIFEWDCNFDYEGHGIATNWQGQAMSQCPGYSAGERWATAWGGEGWYGDAEDGSLALYANPEKTSNAESYLGRRIVTESLTDNSELIVTYKFRTASKPTASAAEVWFVINSKEANKSNETQANSFMIKNSLTGEMEHGFASSTSWPFTAKVPDRDPNAVSFEYDKDYEVEITLKPATENAYRYVAKIKEDGSDKGTVIINEWTSFKPSQAKKPVQLTIATINRSDVIEQEPVIYLKGISMKAKLSDTPLNVSFFPEDNSRNVELDTSCYAEFEKNIEPVSISQVSVTGGAVVESVSMENESKVNIELSNLTPKTSYTITIKDVKGVVADSAYDYSWSFTTDSGMTFSKPYYSLNEEKVSVSDFDDFNVVSVTSDEYINGAWGSANLTSAGLIDTTDADLSKIEDEFRVEDGYIWAYIHNQGSVTEDRTISKHFAPVNDGETLNLSTIVRFNYTTTNDATHYTGGSVELSGAGGNLSLIQFGNSPWRQTVRFLNDGGANYFAQSYMNTDVTTTGQFRWIYDPKQLNGNDLFYSDGTNNGTYIYAHPNKKGDANALDGDITLTLTAKPNQTDDSKYDLTLVTVGPRIDAVSTRTVDKSIILGLTDFHIVTSRSTTAHQVAVEKVIGMKNLEISSYEGGNSPEVGESNIYIDYENIADVPANAEILVVEKDSETNRILSVHVEKLENLTDSGIVTVPVTLEKAGSKLDIYVMNSAEGMVLLTEPETVDVIE